MGAIDFDHVILGAGCAGLSLAVRLAEHPPAQRGRVLVLEAREGMSERTWCNWRFDHPFRDCVSHRWSSIAVHPCGSGAIHRTIRHRPYEQILSSDFESECIRRLERAPDIELRVRTDVRTLEPSADRVRIETDRGPVDTRIAWDARGGTPSLQANSHDVQWIQHFVGWVVRTENPIFDVTTATLMDFRCSQSAGPHFVYVLPYAKNEALIEDTYFSPHPLPNEESYAQTLRQWLREHNAGDFQILRREQGHIPMTTSATRLEASPRIIPIGLRGGAAKPSTGYAFAFIQRQVEAFAAYCGRGESPPPRPRLRTRTDHFFDRVFLSYLQRNHQKAPEVFGSLFRRAPIDSLMRFLSEEASPLDYLAVMNSVPRRGVGLEIARSRRIWLRGDTI